MNMVDVLTPEQRRKNMSRIRGKDTNPEIQLRSMLHRAGYRFRLHYKKLPGSPDIVLPKYRTAIFVHGCFWHRHQGCKYATNPETRSDFWQKKFKENVERDARNRKQVIAAGWRVITVWECDLKSEPKRIFQRICRALEGGSYAKTA